MSNLASALTGIDGERVALRDVTVSGILRDLLFEVSVSQSYRNDEQMNIEAVYTFPLPLDAVLLEMQIEIGGRVLTGTVVEKKAAVGRYEDAVADGDAAVMLETIEPGLYTMNVGNLLPGEEVKIIFAYAILYRWSGDSLRIMLPTTVAPRYGESPHQPHQAPGHSLTVENRFSLEVEITGALCDARFECPSHQMVFARSSDPSAGSGTSKAVFTLKQEKAVMDRDFILNVKAPNAPRSFVLHGPDGDGLAAVASFQPFFSGFYRQAPLNLAIVVDCSGSMEGDSIQQAKKALGGILDLLEPQDRMTMIAFGNSTRLLSDRLLPCDKGNLKKAKLFAGQLNADMGGTEIGKALDSAYAALDGIESADIFLVTDGEVSAWEAVVENARRSGHRIFTVGVGSAVSEAFVRGLSDGTGGQCELVSPREGMAERVIRHFERMRAPRAKRVSVIWPEGALDVVPSRIRAVFEGDTVISCARFDRPLAGGVVALEVENDEGKVMRSELPLSMTLEPESANCMSTIARLAASERLRESEKDGGLHTALRYHLLSPWTNLLAIVERPEGEKAYDIPVLRKTPQTLAAGWHGVGTVMYSKSSILQMDACLSRAAFFSESLETPPRHVEIPMRLRQIVSLIEDDPSRLDPGGAYQLLRESGLASGFDDLFRHADAMGLKVETIAAIVLGRLLGGPLAGYLPPEATAPVEALRNYAEQAITRIRGVIGEKAPRAKHLESLLRETEHAGRALYEMDKTCGMDRGLFTDDPAAREVLEAVNRALGAVEKVRERIDRFQQFYRDLDESIQRAQMEMAEEIDNHQIPRVLRRGSD